MISEPQLAVEFVDFIVDHNGKETAGSWCVTEQVTSDLDVVLHGFARRKDAEIAMAVLSEFRGVDYSLLGIEFWIQFDVRDAKELMSLVCKRLQW